MSVTFRPARAGELQRAQELIVSSINDVTERHGFGAMASVRPASFQLFSLNEDPGGLWVAEDGGEIVGEPPSVGYAASFGFLPNYSLRRECKGVASDGSCCDELFVTPTKQEPRQER
jgi:hypothetical protein